MDNIDDEFLTTEEPFNDDGPVDIPSDDEMTVISFTDSSTQSTPTKSTKSKTNPAKDSLLQDDDETTREDSEKDASFTLCEDPSDPDLVLAVQALGIVCATHRTQRVLAKALTERQREREDEERRKDSITTKVTALLARTLCISPSPSTAQTPVPDDLHRKPPFIPKTPQQIAKDAQTLESLYWSNCVPGCTQYTVWNDEAMVKSPSEMEHLVSACVTGVVSLDSPDGGPAIPTPFISFRGSLSPSQYAMMSNGGLETVPTIHVSESGASFHSYLKERARERDEENDREMMNNNNNNNSIERVNITRESETIIKEKDRESERIKKEISRLTTEEVAVPLGFHRMYRSLRELRKTFIPRDSHNTSTSDRDVRPEVRSLIQEVVSLMSQYDDRLLITGYGLGGACANIFLIELLFDYYHLVSTPGRAKVQLVTFGSPRAMGDRIAQELDRLSSVRAISHLRFVNHRDGVSDLPLSPHYIGCYGHAGKTFYPYWSSVDSEREGERELRKWLDPILVMDTIRGERDREGECTYR